MNIFKLEDKFDSKIFNKYEEDFKKKPSLEKASELVRLAMTGLYDTYYSDTLEKFYKNICDKEITTNKQNNINKQNSTLHVLSEAYSTGGHTRIVERWIQLAENDEINDIVLTNQSIENFPSFLQKATEKSNCNIYQLDNKHDLIKRAQELRDLSDQYEYIVLHHHPDDPIPLIALGSKNINIPIICFNHSGHTFWLGASIIDLSIEINKEQEYLSHIVRGIKNTLLIDMPASITPPQKKEQNIRQQLGIPDDGIVLTSMASDYKIKPTVNLNFPKMIGTILSRNKNTYYLGIGINNNNNYFKHIKSKYKNRVFLLGNIDFNLIDSYLIKSNIFLDTYPYSSWLSVNDAITIGKLPCIILKTPNGHMPYIEKGGFLSKDINSYISRTESLIENKNLRKSIAEDLFNRNNQCCNSIVFKQKITIAKELALKKSTQESILYISKEKQDVVNKMRSHRHRLYISKFIKKSISLFFVKFETYKISKLKFYRLYFLGYNLFIKK